MTCDNCNNKINGSSFCLYCGIAIKCTQCQVLFKPGEKLCGNCGAKRKGPTISAVKYKKNEQANGQNDEPQIPGQIITSDHPPVPPEEAYRRKIPPAAIGVLIAILIFIIIIVANTLKNPELEVKKIVTKYIQAVESLDYQTVLNLYHPDSPDVPDIQEFFERPENLNIEIQEFYDFEKMDEYAEISVLLSLDSSQFDELVTDELYVELINTNNNWYIYDVHSFNSS